MYQVTRGLLIVLSGCSGSGKNSVLRELLRIQSGLLYSVSATTRPPRPGEVHGRDYYFLSTEEFIVARDSGGFLEWAEVYGHYYGTPRSYIDEMTAAGRHVVLDVDVAGALAVRAKIPDAILVFLLPPSLTELRRRLIARGTETPAEIEKRLAQVDVEISAIKSYDYVVVNDEIGKASEKLRSIITAESCAVRRQCPEDLIRALYEGGG